MTITPVCHPGPVLAGPHSRYEVTTAESTLRFPRCQRNVSSRTTVMTPSPPLRRVQEVRQLEDVTGITLLATRPDGTVTLTPGRRAIRPQRPPRPRIARQDACYAP